MNFKMSDKEYFRCEHGPVTFGMILTMDIVDWSGKKTQDFLVSKCWRGVHLYPTKNFEDCELTGESIKVADNVNGITQAVPVDWNGDNIQEIFTSDRCGFIYKFTRTGSYPDFKFEYKDVLRDYKSGYPINIPFYNPYKTVEDNQAGYVETQFFNYTFPVVYKTKNQNARNLIIGDRGGNLWWLKDHSNGHGECKYKGVTYEKDPDKFVNEQGLKLADKFGIKFAKPKHKICDINGKPFLLGTCYYNKNTYPGATSRPQVITNKKTGEKDLLVLAGYRKLTVYYLKYDRQEKNETPVFKNKGPININGPKIRVNHHNVITVNEKTNKAYISHHRSFIAKYSIKYHEDGTIKELDFDNFISGYNVISGGSKFTEKYIDKKTGKKYFVDSTGYRYFLREYYIKDNQIYLDKEEKQITDNNLPVTVETETDWLGTPDWWGCDNIKKWDYNNSGLQHLLIASDTGKLYLLIDNVKRKAEDFKFTGPLKDTNNNVIKLHNRLNAACLDMTGSGSKDLILGGASYQLGMYNDPNPGGGFYLIKNQGTKNGLPVLSPPEKLKIEGFKYNADINSMLTVAYKDIDNDGEKEVILSERYDNGYTARIFKVNTKKQCLVYTGEVLPVKLKVDEAILDVDDDGILEIVHAGGEPGYGTYYKIKPVRRNSE